MGSALDIGNGPYDHSAPAHYHIPAPPPPPPPSLPDHSGPLGHSTETMDDEIETYMHYDDRAARWLCLKCNKRGNSRRNRMRDHVAQCLGYKLYLCGGSCGVNSWYESFFFDPWQIPRAKGHLVATWNSKPNKILMIIEIRNGEHAQNGTPNVSLADPGF